MKKLLCLSALIVYVFACCPCSTTSPPTPPATVQPSPVPPEPTDTPMPPPTETAIPTDTPQPLPSPTETPLPTDTPPPLPTDTPILPTDTPPPPPPAEAQVVIIAVDKRAEYVDIQNIGGAPQDLTGWLLVSEKGDQRCPLGGVIQPGETLRVWAMAENADQGGYNCGYGGPIWNNSERDPAVLYDATGQEVSRK